jgi:hypothetical protein
MAVVVGDFKEVRASSASKSGAFAPVHILEDGTPSRSGLRASLKATRFSSSSRLEGFVSTNDPAHRSPRQS